MMIQRFLEAQNTGAYDRALDEIKSGHKKSHWMWYIFPQLQGLGSSPTAQKYAIRDFDEACEYMQNETLKTRLIEISEAVYNIENKNISEIFGYPDNFKFQSCMTLFALIEPNCNIFRRNLIKYFNANPCEYTAQQFFKFTN